MRLLVSFKLCPNLELLKEEDIIVTEEMGIDTHFLPNIINCYDESALELALRLRDKTKENSIELSAFTVGNEQTELTLKGLRALGFTYTVRAKAGKEMDFFPELAAETMAAYVRENPQECILVGKEAPVGNHGIMAQLVAEKLNYPSVGPVIDLMEMDEKSVTVLVSDEGKILKQTIKLPCILCIGNAVISKLRVATLRERMKVSKTESEYVSLVYPDYNHMAKPEKINPMAAKRVCYQTQKSGKEAVQDVLQSGLKKVLEQI